jgi:hypothetical protein
MQNQKTGDIIEVPPPDRMGMSKVIYNGKVVEHCLYSDDSAGSVTLGDGRRFTSEQFSDYIVEKIAAGGDW